MKTKTIILPFIAGLIAGAVITWAFYSARTTTSESGIKADTSAIQRIPVATANQYFLAYLAHPVSLDTLKAFTISKDQLSAMKMIELGDTTVHGFRIYMGMNNAMPVKMVVGTGSPDRVSTIYLTSSKNSDPCPVLCDDESPIIAR